MTDPLLPKPATALPPFLPDRYGPVPPTRPADAFQTVAVPGLAGDRVVFVALTAGDLLVEEQEGDAPLGPVADTLEHQVDRPYRAWGRREEGSLWSFVANRIETVEVPGESADSVTIALHEGEETVEGTADPAPWRALAKDLDAYVLEAERLDGDLFEVQVSPL